MNSTGLWWDMVRRAWCKTRIHDTEIRRLTRKNMQFTAVKHRADTALNGQSAVNLIDTRLEGLLDRRTRLSSFGNQYVQ
jgi:hypothetical protein